MAAMVVNRRVGQCGRPASFSMSHKQPTDFNSGYQFDADFYSFRSIWLRLL